MALNLKQVIFQSALRSRPVRDNFTEIQNAVNDQQEQIDLMLTPPAGSEVTNARDYYSVLRDRIRASGLAGGNKLVSGGVVSEQGTPDMTVAVSAGTAIVNGIGCTWAGASSGTITAPTAGNNRYDVVVINSDNTLSIVAGTESATPIAPAITASQKALALIYLTDATTEITNTEIVNVYRGFTCHGANVFLHDLAREMECYADPGASTNDQTLQLPSTDILSGDILTIKSKTIGHTYGIIVKSSDGDTITTAYQEEVRLIALQDAPTDATHWRVFKSEFVKKTYVEGTAYSNGTPTLTNADSGWSKDYAAFIPYQSSDGKWYLEGWIIGNHSLGSNETFILNDVQLITGATAAGAAVYGGFSEVFNAGSDLQIDVGFTPSTFSATRLYFNIPLQAKPGWAD